MDKISRLTGEVTLRFYKNGVFLKELCENNLIVQGGYDSLLDCIISGNNNITKVQIGTNGIAPNINDTEITDPVDLTIASYVVSNNILSIYFNIDENTGNGTTFAEFGLMAGSVLFARKSWTPFLKISDLTIEGVWKIKI